MEIFLSIFGGGVITIATAIFVEWLRKPRLALHIETLPLDVPANQPQKRHLRLVMRNKPLLRGFRWMQRAAALQCSGEITFHTLDGQNIFGDRLMAVRWAKSPEPFNMSGQIVDLQNPAHLVYRLVNFAGMESRIDVHASEEEVLDVAVRFSGESDCYGWNNEAYFHNWRTPDWCLPRGTYLVKVVISSSGERCIGKFRLLNEVDSLTGFQLTELLDTDTGKI